MGALDYQLGVKDEATYNTAVVVDRFFEYQDSPTPIHPVAGRTEGNPLRVGSRFRRAGRVVPYPFGAEGTLELDVLTKGFGFWLKHMLGNVATTGAAAPFTHTGTEGGTSSLMGDSFTAQLNYPLHPAGTNQALTCSGGKVTKWKLANTVEQHLRLSLDLDFASYTTATALAVASYPTAMEPLSWVGATVTIGGAAFDVKDFALEVDQGYKTDRRQLRGNTAKKEPTPGIAAGTFAMSADFDSLTQFNRVHSATIAGMSAQIIATWANGTNKVEVTIPGARFDDLAFAGEVGAIDQALTGVVEFDGTNSGVTVAYTTSDATP